MSRTSSVPRHYRYSKDSNRDWNQTKLPKITKNSLSSYNHREKYPILNKDVSNAINNINNDLNTRLKARNEVTQNQINEIQNNYYEIKHLLNNKIDKLEKNQQKVFDYLKYSFDQNKLKNDMNDPRYENQINDYRQRNSIEREKLLNMLKDVPIMIQN